MGFSRLLNGVVRADAARKVGKHQTPHESQHYGLGLTWGRSSYTRRPGTAPGLFPNLPWCEPAYHYLLRKEFEEHGTRIRALNDQR